MKSVPALVKMNCILDVIATSKEGVNFSTILEETNINKSTAYSILSTLEELNYIFKDQHKRYYIDSKLVYLGSKFTEYYKIKQVFDELASETVAIVNETCQLGILRNLDLCYLSKVESTSNIRIQTEPGQLLPAYATAMGKILLSAMEPAELKEKFSNIKFQKLTPNTIDSFDKLSSQIAFFKEHGYVIERGETAEGLLCIAAPIYDSNNRLIAAISYCMLDIHFDKKIDRLIKETIELAREISTKM